MTSRPFFAAAAVAAVASVVVFAQAAERSMYVTVVNDAGAPVEGLGPSDFVVKEDNVAREVLRVVPAEDPMQIEILVDDSQAARSYIADMRTALPGFVDALLSATPANGRNEVGLVAFGERPTILAEPGFDAAQVKKGINRIFAQTGSGSYLLDAIIEVSRGFKKREATRPVIVAITTEGPEFSSRHFDLVLEPLRDAHAALNVIVVGPLSNETTDEAHNRAIVLDQGPRESGGSFENILTSMALGPRLAQLAQQLLHQYKVTYARPQSLIPPEHITVSAARPGLVARGTPAAEARTRP